jgi:hypothetical protein
LPAFGYCWVAVGWRDARGSACDRPTCTDTHTHIHQHDNPQHCWPLPPMICVSFRCSHSCLGNAAVGCNHPDNTGEHSQRGSLGVEGMHPTAQLVGLEAALATAHSVERPSTLSVRTRGAGWSHARQLWSPGCASVSMLTALLLPGDLLPLQETPTKSSRPPAVALASCKCPTGAY